MQFEWDLEKNRRNWRKHGVSFEEAIEVFDAHDALELFDDRHSDFEDRFITLGPIERGLIMVVWTQQTAGRVPRCAERAIAIGCVARSSTCHQHACGLPPCR